MNRFIKLAGSAAVMAAVCTFTLSPVVPAEGAGGSVAVSASADTMTKSAVKQKSAITDISKVKKLSGKLVVNEGETLRVKNGGILYINDGARLVLKGKLIVEQGGAVYVKGLIDSKKTAVTNLRGKIKIMSGGEFRLYGKLNIAENAEVKGKGKLSVKSLFSDISCKGTVTAKIAAPKPQVKNGVTYVGGILLVNKKYSLPKTYGDGIDSTAYSQFLKMKEASGFDMSLRSGFRSYQKQQATFDYWVSIDGYDNAVTYSAKPGQSEHQTGLAIDITSIVQSYGKTAEGRWLAAHCHEYGFIIRYPKGKEKITGYIYEPWHVRYLGLSNAKLVHDSGLSLEEFLGVA